MSDSDILPDNRVRKCMLAVDIENFLRELYRTIGVGLGDKFYAAAWRAVKFSLLQSIQLSPHLLFPTIYSPQSILHE